LKVADLSAATLRRALQTNGLALRTGPVVTRLRSRVEEVEAGVQLHYAEHPVEADDAFCDFHVSIVRPRGLRRWIHPQVMFRFDHEMPFAPLPGNQGFPMLEWGLNWCFTQHCHQYLTLHAAAVERGGRAMILPAPPGSGKSTLCAGLVFRGWRLLSDELAVIEPASGRIVAVPRPVSLKNASIDVIRSFAPDARFGPVVSETAKGHVAHCAPPVDAVHRARETATPAWVVLPRYVADAPTELKPMPKARALMQLIENAFNVNVHARRGFEVLADVVDRSECFEFSYSRLDEATALFSRLADAARTVDH
jgi:HprK-related kinase A